MTGFENEKYDLLSIKCSLYRILGDLLEMNQALLTSLGVSHQALDHVCSIVKNFGELIFVRTEVKGTFYEVVLGVPYFILN
jgi:hypothetical protein